MGNLDADMAAVARVSQRGATRLPMTDRRAVNRTSGITAKGSCIDSTTWLPISSLAVALSP